MLISVLEQSLVFLPLAFGIYISYGLLKIPDLTTDGSFVLGAALFGISVHAGFHPLMAMLIAAMGGVFAGIVVSLLQTRLRLNPLIAGILLVFILNTLTLKLMGRPNLSLFDHPSIFDHSSKIVVLMCMSLIFIVAGACLLATRLGLLLLAFGNNATLLSLSGKNAHAYRMFGLSLSNGLVGFCGALTAQSNGYVDIGMGTGVILIALAAVIMGQQFYRVLFKRPPLAALARLLCCVLGIFAYFFTVNLLISLGLDPIYLRLMIGICLIAFLSMTREKTLTREALA